MNKREFTELICQEAALNPDDWHEKVYNIVYQEAYENGHSDGYRQGHEDGYEEGLEDARD